MRHGVRRTSSTTIDFDQARTILARAYGDLSARLLGPSRRFVVDSSSVDLDGVPGELGPVGLDRLYYGSENLNRLTLPDDGLVIILLRGGSLAADDGRDEARLGPGDAYLLAPDRVHRMRTTDLAERVVRLGGTTLGRVAADATGIAPERLVFHRSRPVSPAHARHWAASLRAAVATVRALDGARDQPLLRAQVVHGLSLAALAVFPNSALDAVTDPARRSPGWTAPASVRRAIGHIEAHADRALSIREIADAAGVSPRALQVAFRRHRDQTPSDHLREVRLRRAHRDLQQADPTAGATVAEVAARWGFAHSGRFATAYRRAYGVSPAHTLRA
ncbi:helix-turn-helix transcriptional regulator [Actinomycetospora chiangmaiensis]|uniref:helix-turn-helix transcriptional regulator n=1 Tax=Actinomycetospora chiangmaiensis TaxID=402650 RepID=UPI001B7F8560|nr:helix-turn-helix domain-containing protein [Actinomycetospora chiangmaiensis]